MNSVKERLETSADMSEKLSSSMPSFDLISEGLYALGTAFRIDDRISWLPPSASGYQATRCYLIKEGDFFLLVDPGLRYQEDIVLTQLRELIDEGKDTSVFLTRSEPDCFGVLEKVCGCYNVTVLTGGAHNPFDGFDDASGAGSGSQGKVVPVLREGRVAPISIGPQRNLEVFTAPLRLNSTFWLYDTGTRSLFTSDGFSHSVGPTFSSAMGFDTDSDRSVEEVRAHLLAKFWWMETATAPSVISKSLEDVFNSREIENICPGHGRPIVGVKAVGRAYELMQAALMAK